MPGQNRQSRSPFWAPELPDLLQSWTATTGTGAEPAEPFSFMGARAARPSSLLMCPIAPDELDAEGFGGVSSYSPPPRRVASAARRASIAPWACIFSASYSVCLSSALLTLGSASLRILDSMRDLHFSECLAPLSGSPCLICLHRRHPSVNPQRVKSCLEILGRRGVRISGSLGLG